MSQEEPSGASRKNAGALIALGQQIRKVRTARGISQEAFAAGADLGRSYFGGVERGERNISALNLMRVAVALEVEVGDLFPVRQVLAPLLQDSRGNSADDMADS